MKFFLNKAKNIRDGLVKHAPPITNASKYLFANDNAADRVTFVGIALNLLLSVGKAVVGVACHSSALVADAGHSLSDLFSDFITLWAVQIARLPPDDDVSKRNLLAVDEMAVVGIYCVYLFLFFFFLLYSLTLNILCLCWKASLRTWEI